jgi:hypothetical protein
MLRANAGLLWHSGSCQTQHTWGWEDGGQATIQMRAICLDCIRIDLTALNGQEHVKRAPRNPQVWGM